MEHDSAASLFLYQGLPGVTLKMWAGGVKIQHSLVTEMLFISTSGAVGAGSMSQQLCKRCFPEFPFCGEIKGVLSLLSFSGDSFFSKFISAYEKM